MGLIAVKCPTCDNAHMWFTGNPDQRCSDCRQKTKSGTDVAVQVLNDLLKLSPEELNQKIEEHSKGEKHWITEVLERDGYFERLAKEKNEKS